MERRSWISRTLHSARRTDHSCGRTRAYRTFVPAIALLLLIAGTAHAGEAVRPDCRIDEGSCRAAKGTLLVTFELLPRPVKVMRELAFAVTLQDKGTQVTDASVAVELTMPGMVMGKNTVILLSKGGGIYEGKGVIVRCPSGSRLWRANVNVRRGGKTAAVPFLFEVQ